MSPPTLYQDGSFRLLVSLTSEPTLMNSVLCLRLRSRARSLLDSKREAGHQKGGYPPCGFEMIHSSHRSTELCSTVFFESQAMSGTRLRILRHWLHATPAQNAPMVRGYTPTMHTVLVRFRYRLRSDRAGLADIWRTGSVLMESDSQDGSDDMEALTAIRTALMDHYEDFGDYTREDAETGHTLFVDPDTHIPDVKVTERVQILRHEQLLRHLGFPEGVRAIHPDTGRATARATRMFGWFDDLQPQHRAFRYLVEGCDVRTLGSLIPDSDIHSDCDRTCAYRMLEERNPPTPKNPNRMFHREAVNQWLNGHGHAVGAITDGLSSDDIQAHAKQHRYAHLAMDLGRSVLNLHVPDQRNTNFKPVCYYLVGDHCQPIVDTDIIRSVLTTATSRLGTRTWSGYTDVTGVNSKARTTEDIPSGCNPTRSQNHKRSRSLDRNYRVDHSAGYQDYQSATNPWQASDAPVDIELEEWDEDFEDNGSQSCVPMGSDAQRTKSRSWQFPLASDTDRYHCFTKENDRDLIESRCHPTYQEGDDPQRIHYYVCTDETDVEFLYQYLLLVRGIDPLRYARSYNGRCRVIRLKNVYWCANPDIHEVLRLHTLFHPTEPFRMTSLATYGFRMLHQELLSLTRSPHTLWDAMCQYSPNLQRLMDNLNPFNRPKICQRTYQPPYSDPRTDGPVATLIPYSHRHRVDLIRSYASTLWSLDPDSPDNVDGLYEYPVHDITNRVVPYDETTHGTLPPGHYLVDIPSSDDQRRDGTSDDWAKLTCFEAGEPRMMSHRMVRALIRRNLLTKDRIRMACLTQPARQRKYGKTMSLALRNVVRKIYTHPELQDPSNRTVKSLVNHLVGVCNGTTLAHSGMRYHFNDLKHLWSLLCTTYAEDALRRTKVLHCVGHDPYWHKAFDYYEIDASGLSHRHFHLQPIYTMVLEDQAVRIFDLARPIPLEHLIQINIDAIEYKADPLAMAATPWAQNLRNDTVSLDEYASQTPETLLTSGYLGRPKVETPKGESKAVFYHFHYNRPLQQTLQTRFLTSPDVRDPEDINPVEKWQDTLRVFEPGVLIREAKFMDDWLTQWLKEGDDSSQTDHNRSGLLLTGPAGTGKTHLLRHLYEGCVRLKLRVLRTAFTHAACIQMGFDAQTLSSLFGIDATGQNNTRRILIFSRRFAAHLRNLNLDVLIVDEISMIPLSILECLTMFHRVSTHTRIVLSGDYNQLPPVEDSEYLSTPNQDNQPPGLLRDYFQDTDIIPYLLYDRVRNIGGRWIRLTECLRANDPLLKQIAENPLMVASLRDTDYPIPNVPVWRYICYTNRVRKACNWYCMQRYVDSHPTYPQATLVLKDVYADHKHASQKKVRTDRDVYLREWDAIQQRLDGTTSGPPVPGTPYVPGHWKYLQDFVYVVGMEVVCRCTLRGDRTGIPKRTSREGVAAMQDVDALEVKNNRRAVIWDIQMADTPEDRERGRTPTITIRWLDRMKISQPTENASIPPSSLQPWQIPTDESDDPLPLSLYDFAFHFVPGFCITAHMAQGETINEHYGVMEWRDMTRDPRMAYVAVTRGRSTALLHLVPWYTDPSGRTDTGDVVLNLMRNLYKLYIQRLPVTPMVLTDYPWLLKRLQVTSDKPQPPLSTPCCDVCNGPLKVSHYPTNPQLRDSPSYRQQFTVFFDTALRCVRLQCMACKEALAPSVSSTTLP